MALPARAPGYAKYLKEAAKNKYVMDRLVDTRRELPEGCHFVKVTGDAFAMAYFIHDWQPTICCKEKVAELIKRTKAVQSVPESYFMDLSK